MTERQPRLIVGLLAAALGAALVVYGALYAIPAWRFAQAEPHYDPVARGKLGSVVELDALTRALRTSPMRADLNRAAFVQIVTAQREGLRSFRSETRMLAARRDLRTGLRASPSDGYAWTRLALAEHRLERREKAAAALSMALQVAPADRKLVALQLDLALLVWYDLDDGGKAAVARLLNEGRKWPDLAQALSSNSADALRAKLAAARED